MQIILSLLLIFGIWNITYSSLTKRKIKTFIADDPEYQIDKAIRNWMKKTGKSLDEEADDDFSIFWDYASNHCAMFLTWAIMHDYCGDLHLSEEPESVEKVKKREMTGTDFFIKYCDCKLTREDFAECILPFVDAYYYSRYFTDYNKLVKNKIKKYPLTFSFSWSDYDIIEKTLNKAYRRWKMWEKPIVIKKR